MVVSLYRAILAVVFLGCLLMPVAHADIALDLRDNSKWTISAGGFWADSSTTIRLDEADGAVGTTIKGEDNLGWEDRTFSPYVAFGYRFNPNHSLLFSYWSLRRDGVKDINFDITVEGETYSGGTTVDSQFITDIYRLTYAYNIFKSKETNVSALLGLHITDMRFKLNAVGTSAALTFESEASAVVPLPTIGISSSSHFAENWYLTFWLQGLKLEYENVDGRLSNTSLAVTYKPHKNYFYSFGIISFDLSVSGTDGSVRGEFIYEYDGPFFSVGTSF